MIDPQRIRDAQSLLARHFGPTPIARAASLSSPARDVFLKIETGLPTGSFKVRGAIYALSVNLARGAMAEVVCASTGNHGAAVAYAAQQAGVRATIFLPADPNPVKAARILGLGARIVKAGADLSAAIDAARDYAERAPAFFLHDASDPDVPIGTATIGMEIVEQLPTVDVIYVPMGDTALIRGVAVGGEAGAPVNPDCRRRRRAGAGLSPVVARAGLGAECGRPAEAADLKVRIADHVVETATCNTIADGLAIRRPLAPNVAAIRELVDDVVMVSEEEMIAAIGLLYAREQVIAEPAGAAAAAALLKTPAAARTSAVLVTGNNIAPSLDPTRS